MSANENELDRDEALAQLTDEERAAIAEDELTDEQRAALKEIADDGEGSDGDGDDDGAGGDGDDDSSEDGGGAGTDGDGEGDDGDDGEDGDGQAEASDGEDDDDDFTPTYKFELPEDFDAQVKAIDDAEADAAAKFKAGDLDADAFIAENRRLAEERRKLDSMRTKAEIASDMSAQTVEQQWTRKVVKFMSKPQDGIDYKNDEAARNDFDASLKALGNNPAYNDKGFDWFLARAHKMALALRDQPPAKGKNPPPKTEAGDKGDKGGKDKLADKGKKPAPRKPKVDKIPPNLANVPGGDGPGDVQDEFADIDNLDGIEYERALAKMTPAQRERYLSA